MTEFDYDKPQQRPEPDREIMARAHNLMMASETPQQRYVRQQWECAMGASRVALDAWRRIWPVEASDSLSEGGCEKAKTAEGALEVAYVSLDKLSDEMEGLRHEVETGVVSDEDLTAMEREREERSD